MQNKVATILRPSTLAIFLKNLADNLPFAVVEHSQNDDAVVANVDASLHQGLNKYTPSLSYTNCRKFGSEKYSKCLKL
ncbi:hypothetical protein BVY02_01305 [bacterium J17]|nr:hypothetical protein BVY02_01305 [bacterium J17]